MDTITVIEGGDLEYLMSLMGIDIEDTDVYAIRLFQAKDGNGVKVKVNGGMWSPFLGTRDGDA